MIPNQSLNLNSIKAVASVVITMAHRKISKDATIELYDIGLVAHAFLMLRAITLYFDEAFGPPVMGFIYFFGYGWFTLNAMYVPIMLAKMVPSQMFENASATTRKVHGWLQSPRMRWTLLIPLACSFVSLIGLASEDLQWKLTWSSRVPLALSATLHLLSLIGITLIERSWRTTFTDYFKTGDRLGTMTTCTSAAFTSTAQMPTAHSSATRPPKGDQNAPLKATLSRVLIAAKAMQSALIPLLMFQYFQVFAFDSVISDPRYRVTGWLFELIMKPTIDWTLHCVLATLYLNQHAKRFAIRLANFHGGRMMGVKPDSDSPSSIV